MMSSVGNNNGGVFNRLSKLYRKRSIGNATSAEEIDTGAEACDWKIHPQPPEPKLISEEDTVSKLFAAISALKLAYIQLQQAHIPYEPKKLIAADELIVSHLDSLSIIKSSYTGKSVNLCFEIRNHEELLEELQSHLQYKDSEIIRLRQCIEQLDRENVELEEEAKKMKKDVPNEELLTREWTPALFSNAWSLTSKSIHDFTKVLIGLMKASGWDLDIAAAAAAFVDGSVVYTERRHKKFAFESYLSMVMLKSDRDDWFKLDQFDRIMRHADPFDSLVWDPDSDFGRFCRYKYLVVVKSKMERSFFGNSDQRDFVLRHGHPNTPFYRAFARVARWVWALQVMARSFIPRAEMFYAKRGGKFVGEYMESEVKLAAAEAEVAEVGLTVMPGFKIGSNVIRCRVYPCKMKF